MPVTVNNGTVTLNSDGTATITSGGVPDFIGTIPVFKPPQNPDINPGGEVMPQLIEHRFLSYSTRRPRGLNHIARSLQLRWGSLSPEAKEAIDSFFSSRAGSAPFWYQLPGEPLRLWTCRKWSPVPGHFPWWSMTAAFTRENDLIS